MSKSVLVMDTPESCDSCNFFGELYPLKFCCANRRYIEDSNKKSIWCPLKLLPEEDHEDHYPDEWEDGYADGWNDCLREIIGRQKI